MIRLKCPFYRNLSALLAAVFFCSILCSPPPARAMTLQEERELGEKVLQEVRKVWPMVQDPAPREYIARIGKRILATLETQPFEYEFYVLNTPEINAFAVPGGKVFFNSGLMQMVESEDELAGVMAHEIGHVVARHIARQSEQGLKLGLATLGALLAGIFLGPQAAAALGVTAQAASATVMLKYSREHEDEADYLGLKFMERAGYDPRGMVTMLKKIRRVSGPASSDPPAYLLTHPAVEQRMGNMEIQMMKHPPMGKKPPSEGNLKRIQTKLVAEERDAARSVAYFENCQRRRPGDPECLFGLGLSQRKMGALDRSIESLSQAASLAPRDGEILRELAAAHFLKANFAEAQKYAEQARLLSPSDARVHFYLGRVYQQQERADDALQAFLTANRLDPTLGENYYHLAMAYGAKNMLGPAYRSLGTYYKLRGDTRTALVQFQKALPFFKNAPQEKAAIEKEIQELTPKKKDSRKDSK